MESKNYSTIYRIIHWAIAFCMLLILITIFLRLTWMNKNHIANIIQDYLATTNQSLSQNQLIVLAKQIRLPMWNWHLYIGYVLVGLFTIRLSLPLFGKMKFQSPFNKSLLLKDKFQYWIYLVFYSCVVISLATGLIIVFGSKSLKKPMEEIHELSVYYLLAFVFIHLGGVLMAELTTQKGIISKIVSGGKKEN
jgi:cytochrome b561